MTKSTSSTANTGVHALGLDTQEGTNVGFEQSGTELFVDVTQRLAGNCGQRVSARDTRKAPSRLLRLPTRPQSLWTGRTKRGQGNARTGV